MDIVLKRERTQAIEQRVETHGVFRFFASHTVLAFFYGIFLFLYELKFLNQLIPVIHPLLIAWTGGLFLYDVLVRGFWRKVPFWKVLALFVVSVAITAALNVSISASGSVKAVILTSLPLVAFYPVCLLAPRQERTKALVKSLLGAAIVVFLASLAAVILYIMRFGDAVQFMGMESQIGIGLYDPRYADSGIILYGLYKDTNHPAVYAVVFALYSLVLFHACRNGLFDQKWANVLGQVFAVANFIVQVCYFPLANSRGGWLSLSAALLVSVFLYLFLGRLANRGAAARLAGSVGAALLCVVLVCGCLLGVRSGLSHLSIALETRGTQTETPNQPSQPSQPGTSNTPDSSHVLPSGGETTDSFEKNNSNFGAGRFNIWRETLKMWTWRPIFGENPGNSAYYANHFFQEGESTYMIYGKAIHNSYLDLLLDYGAVGFACLMCFFVLCMWTVLKRILVCKAHQEPVYFVVICVVVLIACGSFLLSCSFVNTTAMYFVLLIMVGYLLASDEASQT